MTCKYPITSKSYKFCLGCSNVDFKINKCHSSTDTSRNDNMVTTEVPCKIIQFPNPYVKVDAELEEM